MLLLLMPEGGEYAIGPDDARALAELGVSSVSLVSDAESVGFVLEGWAFDAERSAGAALSILTRGRGAARALHAVMHLAVAP